MKTIKARIEGISALLMHAYPMTPIEALDKKPPEEQAELSAYRMPSNGKRGDLFVPAIALQRALVGGAGYSKGKGRGSLAKVAAACLLVSPERLSLGTSDYLVDARPVVIPATKGRVLRYRPRLDKWAVSFDLEFDETLMKATEVRRIVDDTGSRVGLLDFRPEKRGPFGRFMVTEWSAE
jgi:hypothetical protein